MDLQLMKKGFDYTRKRRASVLLLGALGFTGYGAYRAYHSPAVAGKRKKLMKLLGAVVSVAEAVSDSADAFAVVSKDVKRFLQSDSDQIPNSLIQVSKVAKSDDFSESLATVTKALTVGIVRGYRSESRIDVDNNPNLSNSDHVLERLFSEAGTGFASVVAGSFARNLVMALYSDELNAAPETDSGDLPGWVNAVCDERCRELVGECIKLFVGTAVAVYLDKTMHINTYDEMFSGLTNPKNEKKMKEMLTTVCNGAVETLVKTSHQVAKSDSNSNATDGGNSNYPALSFDSREFIGIDRSQDTWNDENDSGGGGWMNKMSSSLAVPSNRKLVLDVTGTVTFEMVRSCLEYLQEKLTDGVRSAFGMVREEVVDAAIYLAERSSAVLTICISVCLHILGGVWILVPA